MERKQIFLKTADDIAEAFNIEPHQIEQVLMNDGLKNAFQLKDGRILTGYKYTEDADTYVSGEVTLYEDISEFNLLNNWGIELEVVDKTTLLQQEALEIEEKREMLLNRIAERANKREGQHLKEITDEVRNLCSELEATIIG